MKKPQLTTPEPKASSTWERLEDFVREHVQQFIQALLEEVTELLGRTKSVRREAVDATPGYRNGYGKPRRLTLTSGTITVKSSTCGLTGCMSKRDYEDTKAALLVMIGVLTNGQKVVLAVESGQRESKESWGMMLRDLRKRGLKPWRCTIADGHLGLWAALGEQYPTLAEQRCWNHRIINILDAMPKKYQAEARTLLCAMPYAETQAACEALRAEFTTRYRKLAPKAVERLADD